MYSIKITLFYKIRLNILSKCQFTIVFDDHEIIMLVRKESQFDNNCTIVTSISIDKFMIMTPIKKKIMIVFYSDIVMLGKINL